MQVFRPRGRHCKSSSLDQEGNAIDRDALAKEAEKEERRINSNIRNLVGEGVSSESVVDEEAVGMSYRDMDDEMLN